MKRLRDVGRTGEAAEIQRLRKPSPAVWAVNQVSRQDPETLARFIAAVDDLKRAHLGTTGNLAPATQHQRDALDRVLQTASRALTGAGLRISPALLTRVSTTLLGAAADRNAKEELKAGRLTRELEAPGFEVFAGAHPVRRPTTKVVRARVKEAAPNRHQRAIELETSAAGHRKAADQAAKTLAELTEQLRQAKQTVRREREAANRAEREARRAHEQAKRAEST